MYELTPLYTVMPPRVRTVLDIVAFVMLASFLGLITERAYAVFIGSYESSSVLSITPLVTPLAVPQAFWFAGFVFVMVIVVLITLRIVVAVVQRDWVRIAQLVGARGLRRGGRGRKNAAAQQELEREHELLARRKEH